jgi:hypothetical protein
VKLLSIPQQNGGLLPLYLKLIENLNQNYMAKHHQVLNEFLQKIISLDHDRYPIGINE